LPWQERRLSVSRDIVNHAVPRWGTCYRLFIVLIMFVIFLGWSSQLSIIIINDKCYKKRCSTILYTLILLFFYRNYRSTPRRKTEIIGTTNHQLVDKFHSLYQPKEE